MFREKKRERERVKVNLHTHTHTHTHTKSERVTGRQTERDIDNLSSERECVS
jgi:hypothetical protein